MQPKRLLAVYLIPYDCIGGVECAARSLPSGTYGELQLQKAFLAYRPETTFLRAGDYSGIHRSENDPRNFIKILIWLHQKRPTLLVSSLWRCYFILILHKLFHPTCQTVCFLHSSKPVHFIDNFLAWFSMLLSKKIWVDSYATSIMRVPKCWQSKTIQISMKIKQQDPVTSLEPSPIFIFWGRLATHKRLNHALELFQAIHQQISRAQFWIVGPDGGELETLLKLQDKLRLQHSVKFFGPKLHSEIITLAAQCSFYLQTSELEGLAMSVQEAMQLGLVPVVTPVGEIAHYCRDAINAIFVSSPDTTAARIAELLNFPNQYRDMRKQAILTWSDVHLYRDQFLEYSFSLLQK
ncbi:glycosyltransferase [Synechococcus elongatus]|uniref:glycosyltransferase n=1 Tax=Synechococcus elongatus TaxID=32046 RepID=UPI0030CEAB66